MSCDWTQWSHFDSREQNQLAVRALIAAAKQRILWLSTSMETRVYDDEAIQRLLFDFVRERRRAQVLCLIRDSRPIVSQGHRLLRLAQRVSSKIQLRKVQGKLALQQTHSVLIVDDIGYLWKNTDQRFEGRLVVDQPARLQEQREDFQQRWEEAQPDPNLRSMVI